jgi:hypothetical protein
MKLTETHGCRSSFIRWGTSDECRLASLAFPRGLKPRRFWGLYVRAEARTLQKCRLKLVPLKNRRMKKEVLRRSRLSLPQAGSHLAVHAAGPSEKAEQLPTRSPDKTEHVSRCERLGLHAGEGLYTPAQVIAAPRRQPMTAGCIPQETERCEQGVPFGKEYRRGGRERRERSATAQSDRMNIDRGVMAVGTAPTGRRDSLGPLSQDSALLHPGLFSTPPSGRRCGGWTARARRETGSIIRTYSCDCSGATAPQETEIRTPELCSLAAGRELVEEAAGA